MIVPTYIFQELTGFKSFHIPRTNDNEAKYLRANKIVKTRTELELDSN